MTQKESTSKDVLYQDQNVKITNQSVKVLKFYFPQDSRDEILFKDINKLGLKQMDQMDQTLGVHASFFKDFNKRAEQNKNMYIQMAVGDQSVRLSFAPDEPLKVMKLIQQKWEDAKIQQEQKSTKPLQQNTLYSNVEVTAQKIQQAMDILKQSQKKQGQNKPLNEKKRSIQSPSLKKREVQEGQNPKKKVKQNDKQEPQNIENKNPNIEAD